MNTPNTPAKPGRLLEEFPAASYDDWRKVVETELKGAPFDKRMFSSTFEGITLKPVYRSEDAANLPHVGSFPGSPPYVRGYSAAGCLQHPWDISQEILCSSPAEFNQAARDSLSRGLMALNMVLDKATRHGHDPDWAQPEDVGCGGLSIATVEDLEKALEGIDLEKVSLFVRSGASAMPFAVLLAALLRRRKQAASGMRGCVEMDPLGVLSHEGSLPQSLAGAYREMAAFTRWAAVHAPNRTAAPGTNPGPARRRSLRSRSPRGSSISGKWANADWRPMSRGRAFVLPSPSGRIFSWRSPSCGPCG